MKNELLGKVMNNGLLTARQKEVLALLARGRAYKEIAHDLDLSLETVRQHIKDIYRRLHVHSRTQAVLKCLQGQHDNSPIHRRGEQVFS